MNEGWIKFPREMAYSWVMRDRDAFPIWIRVLLSAAWKEMSIKTVDGGEYILKPGQFLCKREQLMEWTKMDRERVNKGLKKLKRHKYLTIKLTNKYMLFTVINWHLFQPTNQQNDQQLTSN